MTKTDTSPLMTKLHRIGHSCDCISDLYCIECQTPLTVTQKGRACHKILLHLQKGFILHCWIYLNYKGEINCASKAFKT